jgi:putative heme-binding domain-containing protein
LRLACVLVALESDAARAALADLAERDGDSPWASAAILSGLRERPLPFLNILSNRRPAWFKAPTPPQVRFLTRLAELVGVQNRESALKALLNEMAGAGSEAARFALLDGLAKGQARSRNPLIAWSGPSSELLRDGVSRIEPVRTSARAMVKNEQAASWLRVLALEVLLDTRDRATPAVYPLLLEARQPAELQSAAARGVAATGDIGLVDRVLETWDQHALSTRRILLSSLVSTVPLATRLVEAIASGTVSPAELDPASRDALRRLPDRGLQKRIAELFRTPPSADRRAVTQRYEAALKLKADAARGRSLFANHCQSCHARNGQGAKVGPDLISVAGRPKADLLVAILEPNREVAPDGAAVIVVTTEGQTFTGLLTEETPSTVRLRRPEGLEDLIPRSAVEALRPTGQSLMPEGLEQVLSVQDVADLIEYLHMAEPAPRT